MILLHSQDFDSLTHRYLGRMPTALIMADLYWTPGPHIQLLLTFYFKIVVSLLLSFATAKKNGVCNNKQKWSVMVYIGYLKLPSTL